MTYIAVAALAVFMAYYCVFSAAPRIWAGATPGPGVRIAALMVIVVASQPLATAVPIRSSRPVAAGAGLMALGFPVTLVLTWAGLILVGIGFGAFVVSSTARVKQVASEGRAGRALGKYGLGCALGGAFGSPLGLELTSRLNADASVWASFTAAALGATSLLIVKRTRPAVVNHGEAATEAPGIARRRGTVAIWLAVHLAASSAYAAALSLVAAPQSPWAGVSTVGLAFGVQTSVAVGRALGGRAADRWKPALVVWATVGVLVLSGSVAMFVTHSAPATLTALCAAAAAAGLVQTVVLTVLMRNAKTSASTRRMSAAWNMTFDGGLGLGALAAGVA